MMPGLSCVQSTVHDIISKIIIIQNINFYSVVTESVAAEQKSSYILHIILFTVNADQSHKSVFPALFPT